VKWFDKVLSWLRPNPPEKTVIYGRGIHALPNPREKELFDEASDAFIRGDILQGYHRFLTSLLHSEIPDLPPHLTLISDEESLRFTLIQGSAIVKGVVTAEFLEAHVDIANTGALHVAIKRRFLERNFQLTYCRFSDEKGVIRLSLHLENTTITPQKIFFPLREIALHADFEKEFIASDFDESDLLEFDHMIPINSERARRLYTTMQSWIAQTKASLIGLLSNDNTGMASFSYLSLLLQIDYLFIPRKKMAKNLSEKINGYFLEDEKLTEDKNAELETFLAELEALSFEEFSTQFYDSPYTFSPYEQAMHDDIATFIDESLVKVRWYKHNHSNYVITVIYRYISLYILYNYGLHPALRSLLHLHVEVYNGDFFEGEGGQRLYNPQSGTFQKRIIAERIASAIQPYGERYRGLKNFADELNYTDLDHFSQSFYLHIKNLDFTEA
jgi:hypothetical protein